MAVHREYGARILTALGLPLDLDLPVVAATLEIRAGHVPTLAIEVEVHGGGDEIATELRRYELVERTGDDDRATEIRP